jgi:hypothetical protein
LGHGRGKKRKQPPKKRCKENQTTILVTQHIELTQSTVATKHIKLKHRGKIYLNNRE